MAKKCEWCGRTIKKEPVEDIFCSIKCRDMSDRADGKGKTGNIPIGDGDAFIG